ncbi:MAG: hypothetical protein LBF24_03035 [Puniceicoccales bacterium]|jgi:hypothetical protein|nr:hypothetical protein [Puniceicoccales bacterium]
MASIATVRIACDGDYFDGPVKGADGKKVSIWRGSALRVELALFRRDVWQDLANVAELVVEVKEMGPHDRPPAAEVAPLLQCRIPADLLDQEATAADWEAGTGQQAVAEFTGEETALPAGECWLAVWIQTYDDPPDTVAFAAGRITVRESSAGVPSQPPEPLERFYDKIRCDSLFAKKSANLADLSDCASARQSLGLGSAALLTAMNEEDMASDSVEAVPTQHSAKAYADAADGQVLQNAKDYADAADAEALQNAKDYADAADAEALQNAKDYADTADGQVLQNAKDYADGQIAAIPIAVPDPDNLWPGSLRPFFSSYVERPYFISTGGVCALDGWLIGQSTVTASPKNFFESTTGADAIVFYRPSGSPGTGVYYMNRPFTKKETTPFVGKTVTFSVEFKFGAGFPLQKTGNGLMLSVTASTSGLPSLKVDATGTYSNGGAVVATFGEITAGSTTDFVRHSFTFSLGSNVKMFCITLTHTPFGSGSSLPDDYRFYLARPTIAIGSEPAPYRARSWGSDYINSCQRFARISSAFSGSVSAGEVVYEHCTFVAPMELVPICIRATDESTPVGFPAAAIADVVNITRFGFTVARTASGDGEAKWQTIYGFGVLVWTFQDPIANY